MSAFDEQVMDLGGKPATYAEIRELNDDVIRTASDRSNDGSFVVNALTRPEAVIGALHSLAMTCNYLLDQLELAQAQGVEGVEGVSTEV